MIIVDKRTEPYDFYIYYGALALLLFLGLLPIWHLSFLPLQDYPQHLFLAKVYSTFKNPTYNWQEYYEVNLKIGPYSFFYIFCSLFNKLFSIDTAGRLFLSTYITLTAITASLLPLFLKSKNPPWPGLLLLPLSFHQIYFMGFTNYLISIPILLLTIFDLHTFCSNKASVISSLRQSVLLAFLFLCHPYTVLVYTCLATANALFSNNRCTFRQAILPPLAAILLFAAWYSTALPINSDTMSLLWWPWQQSTSYYFLPFNGMQSLNNLSWQNILPWAGVIIILLVSLFKATRHNKPIISTKIALYFILSTTGFFLLPFWASQYSYFNLRLVPFSYAFAAILFCSAPLPRKAGVTISALAIIITLSSYNLQAKTSQEIATIKPVLDSMKPNAKVLPITFQTQSNILDKQFFPEHHAHDFFYYHILIGGGVNPYLFPSPMLPVQFKPGLNLPKAIHDFSWQEHGAPYDYIITRQAPKGFLPFMMRYTTLVTQSGDWLLFENKSTNR